MRMKTESFVFNKVRENTHVLWNESGEGVVIDPGCSDENEERQLASFLAEQGIRPLAALITHSHFDHVAGTAFLVGRYGTEVWISERESDELNRFPIIPSFTSCTSTGRTEENPVLSGRHGAPFVRLH